METTVRLEGVALPKRNLVFRGNLDHLILDSVTCSTHHEVIFADQSWNRKRPTVTVDVPLQGEDTSLLVVGDIYELNLYGTYNVFVDGSVEYLKLGYLTPREASTTRKDAVKWCRPEKYIGRGRSSLIPSLLFVGGLPLFTFNPRIQKTSPQIEKLFVASDTSRLTLFNDVYNSSNMSIASLNIIDGEVNIQSLNALDRIKRIHFGGGKISLFDYSLLKDKGLEAARRKLQSKVVNKTLKVIRTTKTDAVFL